MKIFSTRKIGKTYAHDLASCEWLLQGKTVTFLGIKNDRDAQKIKSRLELNHGIKTTFKPIYKTPRPRPRFDMSDPETPIIGMDYFRPEITGYEFKKA